MRTYTAGSALVEGGSGSATAASSILGSGSLEGSL